MQAYFSDLFCENQRETLKVGVRLIWVKECALSENCQASHGLNSGRKKMVLVAHLLPKFLRANVSIMLTFISASNHFVI